MISLLSQEWDIFDFSLTMERQDIYSLDSFKSMVQHASHPQSFVFHEDFKRRREPRGIWLPAGGSWNLKHYKCTRVLMYRMEYLTTCVAKTLSLKIISEQSHIPFGKFGCFFLFINNSSNSEWYCPLTRIFVFRILFLQILEALFKTQIRELNKENWGRLFGNQHQKNCP